LNAFGIRGCDIAIASGGLLPKQKNQKMIVIVHDVIHRAFPQGHSPETIRDMDARLTCAAADADAFVVISDATKKDLMKFYHVPEDCIFTVYAGCNVCLEKPEADSARKVIAERFGIHDDYILYVGTLEPRKNIENIVKAYARLYQKGIPVKLVIAGMKGWMFDGIFDTVKKNALADQVVFTDYISHEEKQCLYRLAKVFVYPSFYEGFGLPVLEAMDYGIPVVTSNVSSLPEVAGDAALMVDPYDCQAIADAMEQLLVNDQLRGQLIEKGMERVKIFDWHAMAQEFLNVCLKV
jgi:glycosyltransferase involved in cell wall biosynthesis